MPTSSTQLAQDIDAKRQRLVASGLSSAYVHAIDRRVLCSEFVVRSLCQSASLANTLSKAGDAPAPCQPEQVAAELAGVKTQESESEAGRVLRQLRRREMLRIAWRDLAAAADLDETLAALSNLADQCVQAAVEFAQAKAVRRHGHARDADGQPLSLVTLAMGKLGGSELNFSSDIDIVFLYLNGGETDGPRPLSHSQYFARIAQTAIRLLDAQTEHGFVFRVDTRLRPFGTSGALVAKLESFDAYLQRHGRAWERYAYLKARPITGTAPERAAVAELIEPFVYRRYLDYGIFESLREMQTLIEVEVARRELADDVKRGPGGIREIEFIVQSVQLLRGGQLDELRRPELLPALETIAAESFLAPDAGAELAAAYRFLRRLENRLQGYDDQQTHRLPAEALARERLAMTMNCADWPELTIEIARHRDSVARRFGEVVVQPAEDAAPTVADGLDPLCGGQLTDDRSLEVLAAAGFEAPAEVLRLLTTLRTGLLARLDDHGRSRLRKLLPQLLRGAAGRGAAAETVQRMFDVLDKVGRRSAYFALLNERPAVLARFIDLCHGSAFVAEQVARQPVLLDSLLDPRLSEPPNRRSLQADMDQLLQGVAPADLEGQMEALREFQRAAVLQIAVCDLGASLPLMRVSDRLTDVAELVIERVLELAWRQLRTRYGEPPAETGGIQGLAVIGYGKLGGLELGYGSDLDLVFLYDADPERMTVGGEREIATGVFYTRMVQRIVHMLSTQTVSGALYEVDMRLRPSGRKGLLVSSVAAFGKYQRHEAWTWEHQALLRARLVAGGPQLAERFGEVRRQILTMERDPAKLHEEVAEMRERMRREGMQTPPGRFDLKRGEGGMVDIEFLVQHWVLRWAHRHPELVRYSDNSRQLDTLVETGIVPDQEAGALQEAYLAYRTRLHHHSLQHAGSSVADAEYATERAAVSTVWRGVFGGSRAASSV